MRTTIHFFLTGAVALAAVCACNKEIEQVPDNPNYNAEDGTVLTSFVFNVSSTPSTKMTSANTQATSSDAFRGIGDGLLLSFKQGTPVADGKWIPTDATPADKQYSLGSIYSTSDATTDGTKSHRVIELALPTETNTLMFYGRAPKSGTDADNEQGNILWNDGVTDYKALSTFNFSLNRRVPVGDEPVYRQYGDLIRAALDYITNAELSSALSNNDVTYAGAHYYPEVKWLHYVTISSAGVITPATKSPIDGTDMCAIGEILGDALATFATVYDGEVRAGSGTSVARTLGDLAFVMNKIHETTPTSHYEAIAKAVAEEVLSRIQAVTEGSIPTLNWKTASAVKSATGYTGDITQITRKGSTGSALDEWPDISFGVPKGCAQLGVNTTASTDDAGRVTTPGTIAWIYSPTTPLLSTSSTSIYNVYYPAEICYFGNSPIRITTDAHVESDYPQGVTNWNTAAQWAAGVNNNTVAWTADAHVLSTTRSVAMQHNINYGTALLKSTVGYAVAILEDNNHAIQKVKNPSLSDSKTGDVYDEEPNAQITVTDASFKLTGILVGGQPEKVGWNFVPLAGQTFDHNLYDKAIVSDAIPATGTSAANYTLVWDNWNAANKGAKQNDVYIALEFTNNTGKDFWGNKNVIKNGATFYIIGKLDPDVTSTANLTALGKTDAEFAADKSLGITWPEATLQALPPYEASGATIKERRVFIQDYQTTVNFKIGKESLQHAYATVPDLRSTQISLGLSVDLQWKAGLTFDDIVLGQ